MKFGGYPYTREIAGGAERNLALRDRRGTVWKERATHPPKITESRMRRGQFQAAAVLFRTQWLKIPAEAVRDLLGCWKERRIAGASSGALFVVRPHHPYQNGALDLFTLNVFPDWS